MREGGGYSAIRWPRMGGWIRRGWIWLFLWAPRFSVQRSQNACFSMPNMTGRPGHRTMEMNGGSSAPYLACTPCVPLFSTLFNRGGNRRAFRLPGAGGDHLFPLYGGTFARSYSVSSFKGFGDFWTENRGAPKAPDPTTTDPSPHSRPSDAIPRSS